MMDGGNGGILCERIAMVRPRPLEVTPPSSMLITDSVQLGLRLHSRETDLPVRAVGAAVTDGAGLCIR